MKTKHTPGPWTVEDRVERLLIWADGSHDFIAQVSTVADGADEDAQEAYEEEQQANAALIAAAPQSNEVCVLVVAAADAPMASGKCDGFTRPTEAQWREIVAKARTAIINSLE